MALPLWRTGGAAWALSKSNSLRLTAAIVCPHIATRPRPLEHWKNVFIFTMPVVFGRTTCRPYSTEAIDLDQKTTNGANLQIFEQWWKQTEIATRPLSDVSSLFEI